uniref:Uncharacterized protein n=1 Tax=Candidatus Kentrum sp. LFY TaxID=2126342 RepID=A0A450V247_9GAMM|nr:MAG: hypothetical protein BECKLFY1418B_GA0070995_11302 [Candidatus Kentron sp. LFY]
MLYGRQWNEVDQIFRDSALKPNPAKPEQKFHRMEDMLALRAKTEAEWVLAGAHWFSRDFCFSDT